MRYRQMLRSSRIRAETVAARVQLSEGIKFQRARKLVRDTLKADGVAGEIDELVSQLLGEVPEVNSKSPGARVVAFHLLKSPEADDHALYASHTFWENRAASSMPSPVRWICLRRGPNQTRSG